MGDLTSAASGQPAASDGAAAPLRMGGVIKWFDVTRGFGFAVADDPEIGDVLIHFSVLQAHGRRSLPEGARVEAVAVQRGRGYQAREIVSIDMSGAVPEAEPRVRSDTDRRRITVAATPSAHHASLAALLPAILAIDEIGRGLDPDERQIVNRYLGLISRSLTDHADAPEPRPK